MSPHTCPDYAAIESQQDARRYSDMLDADERRSRAEFEMAADDECEVEHAHEHAIERTLDVIKSDIDAAFDELEIGEYGRERDLIVQVLKLAAGRRDADVVASAVNELLAEIVKNRDADYWNAVDEQARRLRDVWHLSNSIASVACGLSIRSKA